MSSTVACLPNHINTRPDHKRKRSSNILDDVFSDREIKRRTFASLPIRSPPPSQRSSLHAGSSPFFSSLSETLTPVDTSEEDENIRLKHRNSWSDRLPSLTESQSSSESSISSVKVQVDDPDEDMDVSMTMTAPIRPRIGRARSNDILSSPRHHLSILSQQELNATAQHDRIPTPISRNFDSRVKYLPAATHHHFPPLRTNLSPMVEQETWARCTNWPNILSPSDENPKVADPPIHLAHDVRVSYNDCDTNMEIEDVHMVSDQMEGNDLDQISSHQRTSLQQNDQGRTARLHMGYLNGCEKCVQKVPGHYSHIIWT